jgi:hypothetical protein
MNRQITTAILLGCLCFLTFGVLLQQYIVAVILSLVVGAACFTWKK